MQLGKTLETLGRYAKSFGHYANANAMRRAELRYDPEQAAALVSGSRAFFTREFFEERVGSGCDASDPIFIVGLPRSGSSLIEQILSAHSAVEGLGELRDLMLLARELHFENPGSRYPEVLDTVPLRELTALGKRYVEQLRPRRKLMRTRFTDKALTNYNYIGLIQLILPKARIIDVRRHPLACCISNFTRHYTSGKVFTYSLSDLGRRYRDYVELMAHFDGCSRQGSPGILRGCGQEPRVGSPAVARPCGSPLRGGVSAVPRPRAVCPDGQYGTGARADIRECGRTLEKFRTLA